QRTMVIEEQLKALADPRFYRVCIFGSARIQDGTDEYEDVFTLARLLAWQSIDILTGGGPGLMEAANKGAQLGQEEKDSKSLSFGLPIQGGFESAPNLHLDVKRAHQKFSSRLDDFMRLSNAIVMTPGGIGTLLELYFSWQLLQVKHIEPRPIILMDLEYWTGIIQWMKDYPLARGLVSATDFDCIAIVDSPEEVVDLITEHHKAYKESYVKTD
ncbi:LOG family protein, partial [Oligoflexia bacterium]|nr:LOG family protein [Oligoflexia bacterium]